MEGEAMGGGVQHRNDVTYMELSHVYWWVSTLVLHVMHPEHNIGRKPASGGIPAQWLQESKASHRLGCHPQGSATGPSWGSEAEHQLPNHVCRFPARIRKGSALVVVAPGNPCGALSLLLRGGGEATGELFLQHQDFKLDCSPPPMTSVCQRPQTRDNDDEKRKREYWPLALGVAVESTQIWLRNSNGRGPLTWMTPVI